MPYDTVPLASLDWRQRKVVVGGTKDVKLERVAELAPDLVLANHEENTKAAVEALDPVCPVFVTDIATVQQALSAIVAVGTLVGKPKESGRHRSPFSNCKLSGFRIPADRMFPFGPTNFGSAVRSVSLLAP